MKKRSYGTGEQYWSNRATAWGTRAVSRLDSATPLDRQTEQAWQGLVAHLPAYAGGPVLDFGAGWGRFTQRLRAAGVVVSAVDATQELCALSGGLVQRIEVGKPLPFPDDAFAGLFVYAVLQHIPDTLLPTVCAELRRVLRLNAYLLVCDPVHVPGWRDAAVARPAFHSFIRPLEVYSRLLPGLKLCAQIQETEPDLLCGRLAAKEPAP